jgi:hypothetical protein
MLTALLYTILIMSIRSKARNLFPISLMTISTISALFIIEVRSETLPMIPSRKLFFVVLSNLGYDLFVCPHCGNESIVPHKCHFKLCTSCGSKEAKLRAVHIFSIALDAKHRHIVFNIPKHLRGYFIKDRSLLNLLFIGDRNTLACVFNEAKYRKIKKKKLFIKKANAPTLIKITETRSFSVLF